MALSMHVSRSDPEGTPTRVLKKRKILVEAEEGKMMKKGEEEEDRISHLPDVILCSILSLVHSRESVRSGILSSSWRNLWTDTVDIDLDVQGMLHPNLHYPEYRTIVDSYRIPRFDVASSIGQMDAISRSKVLTEIAHRFIDAVGRFLGQHGAVAINTFRLCFFFRDDLAPLFDQWIEFAAARCVKVLNLDFNQYRTIVPGDFSSKPYEFPFRLFSAASLKHLRLEFCAWNPPPMFGGFSSLITLDLTDVDLVDKDVRALLLNSPLLERLELTNCQMLFNLEIEHPSLKYLSVESWQMLKQVVLRAPNLAMFEYKGNTVRFSFDHVPRLKRLSLSKWNSIYALRYALTKLPLEVPQLKNLFLFIGDPNPISLVKPFRVKPSIFSKLNRLAMSVRMPWTDLLWITSLLDASPLLRKFQLHLFCNQDLELRGMRWPPKCLHYHLEEVEMTGFTDNIYPIELAVCLLISAINLKVMTVDPQPRLYVANDEWEDASRWFPDDRAKTWAKKRRMVEKELRFAAASTTRLVIL